MIIPAALFLVDVSLLAWFLPTPYIFPKIYWCLVASVTKNVDVLTFCAKKYAICSTRSIFIFSKNK